MNPRQSMLCSPYQPLKGEPMAYAVYSDETQKRKSAPFDTEREAGEFRNHLELIHPELSFTLFVGMFPRRPALGDIVHIED